MPLLALAALLTLFPMMDALAAEGRPRIGLALSGGGARGAAHVGVIKILEELRIPIDYIAGTSMGAIVGGLYASGMSAEELEHTLGTLDWDDVFSDLPPRPERSMRRKTDDRVYMTRLEAGVKGTEVGIKPALILGQKFNLVLRKLTLPVAGEQDFDRLRIPFRCVATNIENGQPVILESGDLARAMVASMAVPAAFGTVEWNGLLLVDGGMANNLPVSVVRAMGADIVIAVDISAPTLSREKLRNPLAVVDQLTTLMTRRVTDQEIASLGPRDLLIVPPLKDIGSMDFKRAREAIDVGETAARGMRGRLAALSLSESAYGAYLAQRQSPPKNLPRVAFVRFKNHSRVSDQVLAENLGLTPGTPLDVPTLEKGLARIYGLEVFESVRYQILEENGQTGVLVEARERSWGTNTLQAGMELATGLSGGSAFSIGAAYTLRPLNEFNGEWRTLGSLGEEQGLATEIYQPLTPDDEYFLRGALAYQGRTTRIYEGNQPRAEYEVRRYGIELAGGRNLDRWGRLEAGLRRYAGDTEVVVGEENDVMTGGDFNDGQAYLRLGVDTLDSFFFPRTGHYGILTWTASRGALGADTDYDQLDARWLLSRSWGKHTLLGSLSLGTTLDDAAPPQNLFQIGGFLNLSGLSQNQFAGQHLGFGYLGYLYRWNDTLVPIYLGFSLEAGNVWQDSGDFGSDLIQAGSLFAGADTPLGPLYVGYGWGSLGESAFYLFLGQPWL